LPVTIIVLLLALGGCAASQAPLPDDHYFRLVADAPPPRGLAEPRINGLLMVEELHADALHNERALLYSEDPGHRTIRRDHYNYWSDPPPRTIQSFLVQRLRTTGLARQTLHYDIDLRADAIISGRVERFEQLIDGAEARVVVALTLQWRRPDANQPRLLRDYTEEVKLADTSPRVAISGIEQALSRIIDRFLDELIDNPGPSREQ
jgi:ABC-type uncharacterized transport system auxiliary subunit